MLVTNAIRLFKQRLILSSVINSPLSVGLRSDTELHQIHCIAFGNRKLSSVTFRNSGAVLLAAAQVLQHLSLRLKSCCVNMVFFPFFMKLFREAICPAP